jgi:hypothetical protein
MSVRAHEDRCGPDDAMEENTRSATGQEREDQVCGASHADRSEDDLDDPTTPATRPAMVSWVRSRSRARLSLFHDFAPSP